MKGKLYLYALKCCPELKRIRHDRKLLVKAIRTLPNWLPRYLDRCERTLGRKADRLYDKARLKYPDKVTKDGFRRAFCMLILLDFIGGAIHVYLSRKWAYVFGSILEELFSLLSVRYDCWIEYQILFNLYEQGIYIIKFRHDPNIIKYRLEALLRHVTRAVSYRLTKDTKLQWLALLVNSIWHVYHNLKVLGYT